MQLHAQAAGLDGWVGSGEGLSFFNRGNIEDINATYFPVVHKRTCQYQFAGLGHSDDVFKVRFLQIGSSQGILIAIRTSLQVRQYILSHAIWIGPEFLGKTGVVANG